MINELIPAIKARTGVKVTDDPKGHGIGGTSSGGVGAFTSGWHRPDFFRRIFTCNGSFVDLEGAHRYPDLIAGSAPKPLRVALLSGDKDAPTLRGGLGPANRRMAAALKRKGYTYRLIYGAQVEHDARWCMMNTPFHLTFVWAGFQP